MKLNKTKQKILIVDDSFMNRAMLIDMLESDYDILEAGNGAEAMKAIREYGTYIDLMLLDIVMPEIDGFEVLAMMNECRIIEDIPVIMISSENQPSSIERAYEMGVTDYISRPFNVSIVRRRVMNTLNLHAKHKKLNRIITDLVYEKEKNNSMMVNILSHIVEFRNGESGLHVLHISSITNLLLQRLIEKTDQYPLSQHEISLITIASALHDIGKISIPSAILNKPGKLTAEEFDTMKTHTVIGESLLKEIPLYKHEPLVKIARQICRWHHERYDGRGYPDGLKGEEIPICAQVVALADVYDALTSERCYKKAFSHEKALQMILNGECGIFSELLLGCLTDMHKEIIEELGVHSTVQIHERKLQSLVDELMQFNEFEDLIHPLRRIIKEREKSNFYALKAEELQFDYDSRTSIVILSEWGAQLLGLKGTVHNIDKNNQMISEDCAKHLKEQIQTTSPKNPDIEIDIDLIINGELMHGRMIARTTWSDDKEPKYIGVFGKIAHLNKIKMKMGLT